MAPKEEAQETTVYHNDLLLKRKLMYKVLKHYLIMLKVKGEVVWSAPDEASKAAAPNITVLKCLKFLCRVGSTAQCNDTHCLSRDPVSGTCEGDFPATGQAHNFAT